MAAAASASAVPASQCKGATFNVYLNPDRCAKLNLAYAHKKKFKKSSGGLMPTQTESWCFLKDFVPVMYELDDDTYTSASHVIATGLLKRHYRVVFVPATFKELGTFPGHFVAHTEPNAS
jgi:hypothetical protein